MRARGADTVGGNTRRCFSGMGLLGAIALALALLHTGCGKGTSDSVEVRDTSSETVQTTTTPTTAATASVPTTTPASVPGTTATTNASVQDSTAGTTPPPTNRPTTTHRPSRP